MRIRSTDITKFRPNQSPTTIERGETLVVHQRLHPLDSAVDHAPASVEDYGNIVRANPVNGKAEYFTLINYGTKETSRDSGEFKEIAFDQNWIYFCVVGGAAGDAVWKKFPLLNT